MNSEHICLICKKTQDFFTPLATSPSTSFENLISPMVKSDDLPNHVLKIFPKILGIKESIHVQQLIEAAPENTHLFCRECQAMLETLLKINAQMQYLEKGFNAIKTNIRGRVKVQKVNFSSSKDKDDQSSSTSNNSSLDSESTLELEKDDSIKIEDHDVNYGKEADNESQGNEINILFKVPQTPPERPENQNQPKNDQTESSSNKSAASSPSQPQFFVKKRVYLSMKPKGQENKKKDDENTDINLELKAPEEIKLEVEVETSSESVPPPPPTETTLEKEPKTLQAQPTSSLTDSRPKPNKDLFQVDFPSVRIKEEKEDFPLDTSQEPEDDFFKEQLKEPRVTRSRTSMPKSLPPQQQQQQQPLPSQSSSASTSSSSLDFNMDDVVIKEEPEDTYDENTSPSKRGIKLNKTLSVQLERINMENFDHFIKAIGLNKTSDLANIPPKRQGYYLREKKTDTKSPAAAAGNDKRKVEDKNDELRSGKKIKKENEEEKSEPGEIELEEEVKIEIKEEPFEELPQFTIIQPTTSTSTPSASSSNKTTANASATTTTTSKSIPAKRKLEGTPKTGQVQPSADKAKVKVNQGNLVLAEESKIIIPPKQDTWECESCGEIFRARKNLSIHRVDAGHYIKPNEDINLTTSPLQCPECFKLFKSSITMKIHLKKHVKRKCPFCQELVQAKKMESHMKTHNEERPLKCLVEDCPERFSYEWSLKTHMNKVHSHMATFKCDFPGCKEIFLDDNFLKEHVKKTHDPKSFPCKKCKKEFRSLAFLTEHSEKIHKYKKYPCYICKKSYGKYQLASHIKTVHGEKKYQCEHCKMKFTTRTLLSKHGKVHEENREKSYVCNQCGKSYLGALGLKKHIYSHTGERPYRCNQCPKAFKDSQTLKIHKTLHGAEKTEVCEICQQKFSHKSYLKLHLFMHERSRRKLMDENRGKEVEILKESLKIDRRRRKRKVVEEEEVKIKMEKIEVEDSSAAVEESIEVPAPAETVPSPPPPTSPASNSSPEAGSGTDSGIKKEPIKVPLNSIIIVKGNKQYGLGMRV